MVEQDISRLDTVFHALAAASKHIKALEDAGLIRCEVRGRFHLCRLDPGPVERVWAYLTESDKRRQWLAAGEMTMATGAPFTLNWRNDQLTDPPGARPQDFGEEHSMDTRITELLAPYRLAFAWDEKGEVVIDLEPKGGDVLLTLVHKRLSDRKNTVMIGAGWHAHLDILAARLSGRKPEPFWDHWLSLKEVYDRRIPK